MRQQLLELFQTALNAVHGQLCVRGCLATHQVSQSECTVVAIGKAAQSMATGVEEILSGQLVSGILITKYNHAEPQGLSDKWQIIEAAHPIPDQQSLTAGQALLDFLANDQHRKYPVIFLISGGASSLVEVLPDGITSEQWQKMNAWLLASGLDIEKINQLRKTISLIKGGKLLAHLQDREVHALLVSDVPGDQPQVIGSGLLFADTEEQEHELEIPGWLQAMINQSVKSAGNLKLTNTLPASHHIVASNRVAMEAIEKACKERQQEVYLHSDFLDGEAADTGRQLAMFLLNEAEPGIHIWGGETVVRLPDEPGRGGRNQQLALAAASVLKGNQKITLLAAGTDGSDGPTEDAGGIVDGGTVARGQLSELDVESCLAGADAGTFLEAAGDLLYTGPTGSNVMDLVIAIKTG